MAADIHLYVEHYNKESKRWENISLYKKSSECKFSPVDIYDGRDYELFGLLAGVRSMIDPFVLPRGVPNDMSCEVSKVYGDGKYWHTPTWYDYCELQAYEYMMTDSCEEIAKRDKKIAELEKTIKRMSQFIPSDNEEELYDNVECDVCDVIDLCKRLHGFVNDIEMVLNAYDIYYPKPGDIRIVMWFDS